MVLERRLTAAMPNFLNSRLAEYLSLRREQAEWPDWLAAVFAAGRAWGVIGFAVWWAIVIFRYVA